jgi:hypothetical protein
MRDGDELQLVMTVILGDPQRACNDFDLVTRALQTIKREQRRIAPVLLADLWRGVGRHCRALAGKNIFIVESLIAEAAAWEATGEAAELGGGEVWLPMVKRSDLLRAAATVRAADPDHSALCRACAVVRPHRRWWSGPERLALWAAMAEHFRRVSDEWLDVAAEYESMTPDGVELGEADPGQCEIIVLGRHPALQQCDCSQCRAVDDAWHRHGARCTLVDFLAEHEQAGVPFAVALAVIAKRGSMLARAQAKTILALVAQSISGTHGAERRD